MKKFFLLFSVACLLSSCELFDVRPQPFPVGTVIPSRTPAVVTATPIIMTPTLVAASATNTAFSSETPTATVTPTLVPPSSTPGIAVEVVILGCNTSIDVLHGMGEVTNAFVTVRNTGGQDLPNTCSLLRAIDEDRQHPDKKGCVPNLPVRNQVTFKLTVDSAYKQDTIIQVDTLSNEALILRVDKQSCLDIGLFGGTPADIGVVKPLP